MNIYDNLDPHNQSIFTRSITTNIKHFDIREIYVDELDRILSSLFLPQVKSFHTSIYIDKKWTKLHNNGLILDSLIHLRITVQFDITFERIELILKRTPNLQTLSISASQVTFIDGQKWEYFVSKYLEKIEPFHLSANDREERN